MTVLVDQVHDDPMAFTDLYLFNGEVSQLGTTKTTSLWFVKTTR
jgi:hypothetical protein